MNNIWSRLHLLWHQTQEYVRAIRIPRGPKYRMSVNFIFRSGVQIVVECDSITINRKGTDLVSYELTNPEDGALYIRAEDVSAIIYLRH